MRILLAHDGSPSARQAVDLLGAVRWSRDMTLRVISSAEGTAMLPDPLIGGLRPTSADAEVRTGDPAGEIIASADRWDADLVLMGSRGDTGLPRVLLDSVARNVVHGGGASVLIVHAPAGN
jgi:hypothetical protein